MSLLDGGKSGDSQKPDGNDGLESYVAGAKPAAAKKPASAAPAGGGVFSGLRVSLMPSELEGRAQADPGKRLLALGLVLVVETVLILGAHFFINKAVADKTGNRDELLAKVEELSARVAKEEAAAKDVVAYQTQISAANESLDGHISWTSFFSFLEKRTSSSVKYLNFSGDADGGTVTLDAVGTSYRDVAEQIVRFREDPLIADVRTSSASARVSDTGEVIGVSFTLVIRVKPEVWRKTSYAAPAAPSTTTVPGSATVPGDDASNQPDESSIIIPAPVEDELPGETTQP
jgi:hypothetical protein